MTAEVDPKVLQATQELLGRLVKKPVLSEKLLKRPPFKFLHDVLVNVIKGSDFMKGLYKSEELVADNLKDKESKVAFLQKAVEVLALVTGETLSVKPSKVVAGLEPEKTNEFLQKLSEAAFQKLDSTDAVQKVLKGGKKTAPTGAGVKKAAPAAKKAPPDAKRSQSKERKNSLTGQPANGRGKSRSPLKTSNQTAGVPGPQKPRQRSPSTSPQNRSVANKPEQVSSASSNKENPKESLTNGDIENGASNETIPKTVEEDKKDLPQFTVRPPTGAAKIVSSNDEDKTDRQTQPSARPTTARAAPPRVVRKQEVEQASAAEMAVQRLVSAKPVANVILEKKGDDEEDEDNLFMVEESNREETEEMAGGLNRDKLIGSDSQKGSLVKQLVETKKELEGNKETEKAGKEEPVARLASRDIEKLRQSIQTLSRSANPLGRVLDYLQEDIDIMLSEARTWQEEYQKNTALLEKERSSIDGDLVPLRGILEKLDDEIVEQLEKISGTKSTIIRNEERLNRMISMVVEKT